MNLRLLQNDVARDIQRIGPGRIATGVGQIAGRLPAGTVVGELACKTTRPGRLHHFAALAVPLLAVEALVCVPVSRVRIDGVSARSKRPKPLIVIRGAAIPKQARLGRVACRGGSKPEPISVIGFRDGDKTKVIKCEDRERSLNVGRFGGCDAGFRGDQTVAPVVSVFRDPCRRAAAGINRHQRQIPIADTIVVILQCGDRGEARSGDTDLRCRRATQRIIFGLVNRPGRVDGPFQPAAPAVFKLRAVIIAGAGRRIKLRAICNRRRVGRRHIEVLIRVEMLAGDVVGASRDIKNRADRFGAGRLATNDSRRSRHAQDFRIAAGIVRANHHGRHVRLAPRRVRPNLVGGIVVNRVACRSARIDCRENAPVLINRCRVRQMQPAARRGGPGDRGGGEERVVEGRGLRGIDVLDRLDDRPGQRLVLHVMEESARVPPPLHAAVEPEDELLVISPPATARPVVRRRDDRRDHALPLNLVHARVPLVFVLGGQPRRRAEAVAVDRRVRDERHATGAHEVLDVPQDVEGALFALGDDG